MTGDISGRVFNIQRYSIHDGSGIRTLVFLKGCPLSCLWCSNPESRKATPELGYIEARCTGAGTCGAPCVSVCTPRAIRLNAQDKPEIDRSICDVCGECARACNSDAFTVVGREMHVDEVMAEVEKDRAFYRRSGGGVTIGGGEPLAQYRFAAAILEAAGAQYLHTAIETSGHASWKHFESVLKHVDLLQLDLKHMDPQKHRELTGQSNELILENLGKVLSVMKPQDVIIRVPVIPGYTDTMDNIEKSARFISELGFTQIELIPYHGLGASKYAQYGLAYPLEGSEAVPQTDMQHFRSIVEGLGLQEMTGMI